MLITQAYARCAGAGRTNCSVGVGEETLRQIEEANRQQDQIAMVVLLIGALVTAALVAWFVWAIKTNRI